MSLKDYISVIKVTPDRTDLAGYAVHPLLLQGFLLQPGPHCRALSGSQRPAGRSSSPFPGEAVL